VTAFARAAFAALVVATFAAFFVAQSLKSRPPRVQELGVTPFFSPNQDGRFERAAVTFQLDRGDIVDLDMVDRDGDVVRELVIGRRFRPGQKLRARWDGLDDAGRRVPDGTYRARVGQRRQGRTFVLPRNIRLDTTPPQPRVLSVGPQQDARPVPELLPRRDGRSAEIRFRAPGRRPSVEIWRTDLDRPRLVDGLTIEDEPDAQGVGRTTWDGTAGGRRVAAGTYVAVVRSRDQAGNIGQSVPDRVLRGRPRRGEKLPGRGGITVRYLALQPPLLPTGAGRPFEVAVDARGRTYNWTLRKVGEGAPIRRSRRATGGPLRRRAPGGESGLYLFEARTRDRAARVPVAVDDRRNNRVLVVLPATTWNGRTRVDDDGDGLPNTLELGTPVRLERVFAGDGLPDQVERDEGPLLAALHRQGLRFDLTTDVALAVGRGPQLEGHRGVLLAGDTVWLTEDVRRRVRGFVAAGGTLASFGTGSLRSEVRQTPRRLLDAQPLAPADLFGARLGPVQRRTVDVTILDDDERVQLFAGEEGLFPRVEAWEPTLAAGDEARPFATAVTDDDRAVPVIVGARFGDGIVLRTGIPGFAARVSADAASAELLGRMWTLLRTG
jgi:hypothetical protein